MINLSTHVDQLTVLAEALVDFKDLATNKFNLRDVVSFQNWANYFERLYEPVYSDLVKDFWIHAYVFESGHVCSSVHGKKIFITEKDIAKLYSLERTGTRLTDVSLDETEKANIANVIFQEGSTDQKAKSLISKLRVWFMIILGSFNPRCQTNSPDYVNNDQKYLLHAIHTSEKVNLPAILFKHLKTTII